MATALVFYAENTFSGHVEVCNYFIRCALLNKYHPNDPPPKPKEDINAKYA
jgi:hypothetical protein